MPALLPTRHRPPGRGAAATTRRLAAAALAVAIAGAVLVAGRDPVPSARIVHPQDGAVVGSQVAVVLAAEHVRLTPCADPDPCGGHLTVLVDRPCVADGEVVPSGSLRAAEAGVHGLSDGGRVLILELEPGVRTLCTQLADGLHVAFGSTHTITVTVDHVDVLPRRAVTLRRPTDRP